VRYLDSRESALQVSYGPSLHAHHNGLQAPWRRREVRVMTPLALDNRMFVASENQRPPI